MKILRTLAAVSALVVSTAGTASAQFTVYTNRTAFQNALAGFYVDDFNGNAITTPGASVSASSGSFGSGRFNDQANQNSTPNTIWSFLNGTVAFGGEWDAAGPGGPATGLAFSVDFVGGGSASVGTELPNSTSNSFWGFISNQAFSKVYISEGTQSGGVETYYFDNMTTGTTSVPEPSSYMLVATGLAGIFAARRRRKS